MPLSGKHRKTLAAVFAVPFRSNLGWSAVEKLLVALGAELSEGRGSRVRVHLSGMRAVFHRPHPHPHPHPHKDTDKGALRSLQRFLSSAGVGPEDEE